MAIPVLELMIKAARQSGELIKQNFRQSNHAQNKTSHLDIVTQTDRLSQQGIHECLISGMNECGVNSSDIGFVEEESSQDSIRYHNFIVDPLDGTSNFASGIPYSCVSIAYAEEQEVKMGVVFDPFTNSLYWGEKNQGAFIQTQPQNQRQLKLLPKPTKSWMVASHFNGLEVVAQQFASYQKIYPQVRGLRNMGSITLDLCLMADNIFDVVLNRGCYFWDLAAAKVILEEAGGKIYSLAPDEKVDGQDLSFDWIETKKKYQIMASHPETKAEALKLLRT